MKQPIKIGSKPTWIIFKRWTMNLQATRVTHKRWTKYPKDMEENQLKNIIGYSIALLTVRYRQGKIDRMQWDQWPIQQKHNRRNLNHVNNGEKSLYKRTKTEWRIQTIGWRWNWKKNRKQKQKCQKRQEKAVVRTDFYQQLDKPWKANLATPTNKRNNTHKLKSKVRKRKRRSNRKGRMRGI